LTADCRYEGQGYELNLTVGSSGAIDDVETIRQRFHEAHEAEFGHSFPGNSVEVVNERITGYGYLPSSEQVSFPEATTPAADHVLAEEVVHFRNEEESVALETPFFERNDLRASHSIEGPAVIGEKDSTTVVPPNFTATVLAHGDLEITQTE